MKNRKKGDGQGPPLVVIFNRRALAARALRRSGLEQALNERNLRYEIIDTETAEGSRDVAEQAARNGKVVVAAGGDGTARDVVNGLLAAGNSETVMGVIPLGTGNDLSQSLGRVGRGLEDALDALVDLRTTLIDVAEVNGGEFFVNVLGVGFDAEVARRRERSRVRLPGYFLDVILTMLTYRPQAYRVTWPDGAREGPAQMIAAMNGRCEGGGFRIAPEAQLSDGLLDIYWIDPISFWQFLRYVWAVRRGTHIGLPMVRMWRADWLRVESETRLQYQIDGEYRELPPGEPLQIKVHRQRLRMIT